MLVQTAEELYPPKPYSAIEEPISEEEKTKLKIKLSAFGNTVGFTWLLQSNSSSEEPSKDCEFPVIEEIILSDDFTGATNKIEYLKQKCALDDDRIKQIAAATSGQVSNELWYLIRKFRLTASNFGTIIASCKRNRYPDSLFKKLIGKLLSYVFINKLG